MIFFLVAVALVLHVLFWGAGLARLILPRPWNRYWIVLGFPAGLALQSATVWAGAMADLKGTDTYGWPSLLLPLALLLASLRRGGVRAVRTEAGRFGGVWLAGGVSLGCLVLPLSLGLTGLTTVSLGSCDAADYAAGARVLMEFARTDRDGFLGLAEVVRVHSVDNFFDYWIRLNHFTPAALLALNGSVLDCVPHELTTVFVMVLVAGSVPVVCWFLRTVVGLRPGAAGFGALLYGLSPVTWYAAAQVAPGQLIAAQGIAWVTWAGLARWRMRGRPGAAWKLGGVLALAYWLLLGSYNFIVVVCLVPAAAIVTLEAAGRREWRRLGSWSVAMLWPLLACGVVFNGRVIGLAERFTLLREYDFGWPIPALTPEGWLGWVERAPELSGMETGWRVLLALIIAAAVISALIRWPGAGRRVAGLALPVLAGYGYLQWRGAALGTNASYDAYKLLAVFFPAILGSSLVWLRWLPGDRAGWRWIAGVLATLVFLAHWRSVSQYYQVLQAPPLRVTLDLRDVRKVERMPDVRSVNLLVSDMWSRLWANSFLLHKPQYFPTHTYEARLNTPLRGEWDLLGGLIGVVLPDGGGRRVSANYSLVRRADPHFAQMNFGAGWHAEEVNPATGERWRWSAGSPAFVVENPQPHPLRVALVLEVHSAAPREIAAHLGDARSEPVPVGEARSEVRLGVLTLPPGRSTLRLESAQPAVMLPGDSRPLGIAVRRVELHVVGR